MFLINESPILFAYNDFTGFALAILSCQLIWKEQLLYDNKIFYMIKNPSLFTFHKLSLFCSFYKK